MLQLSELKSPGDLQRLLRSLAALDAILCPEWEFRYYSYNRQWDNDEELASYRNGQGDEYFALFRDGGCFVKGFCAESALGMRSLGERNYDRALAFGIPDEYSDCLTEPAFEMQRASILLWYERALGEWKCGNPAALSDKKSGCLRLFRMWDVSPATYKSWAEEYYEREIALEVVREIYDHAPITDALVRQLSPERDFENLSADLREIGYPVA